MNTTALIVPLNKFIPIAPQKKESLTTKMAIPLKNKIEIIAIDLILYLKSDSNYTEFHMDDDKKIISSTTLKRYACKLCSKRFIRVHNSYLVNTSYLTSYLSKLNKIVLQNLQEIPVSNGRKEGLLNYLKTLMVSSSVLNPIALKYTLKAINNEK